MIDNIINKLYYFEENLILKLIFFCSCNYGYGKIDKISKYLSSRKYQTLYFFILIIYCLYINFNIYNLLNPLIKILFIRLFSYYIKNILKWNRPFVNNPALLINIKDNKKRKSYSFPSNSIINTFSFYYIIIYDIILNIINISIPNYLINIIIGIFVLIVGYTKIKRGLHYIHDILLSCILSTLINYLINKCNIINYN